MEWISHVAMATVDSKKPIKKSVTGFQQYSIYVYFQGYFCNENGYELTF